MKIMTKIECLETKGNSKHHVALVALEEVKLCSLSTFQFPTIIGNHSADQQENCVTGANNWKISASCPNDPQYTDVILL